MSDDLRDAIETVQIMRSGGMTAAEIISSVGQRIPPGQIGNDDAVAAVLDAWAALRRPCFLEAA